MGLLGKVPVTRAFGLGRGGGKLAESLFPYCPPSNSPRSAVRCVRRMNTGSGEGAPQGHRLWLPLRATLPLSK